ncbi:MAG: ferric reductase-like transmembrane domain-containing protein [Phormidesmis sp.]
MDNALGLLATLTYVATLIPSNFKVIFPAFKYSAGYRVLIRNRRSIGLWTFALSVAHACIILYQQAPHLSEVEFYRKSISGLLLLFIFSLLAITSNNWSIRKLQKNWKRLHSLTYVAAFLIPWHICAKMVDQWSIATFVCMGLSINLIGLWTFKKYQQLARLKGQGALTSLTRLFYLRFLLLTSPRNIVDYRDGTPSRLNAKR